MLARFILWCMFILYLFVLTQNILIKHVPVSMIIESIRSVNPESIQRKLLLSSNWVPFQTILGYLRGEPSVGVAMENLIGNVVGFAPLGFLLPLVLKKRMGSLMVALVAFFLSLGYELFQLVACCGSFDVDDLLLNTLGALFGYLILRRLIQTKWGERFVN